MKSCMQPVLYACILWIATLSFPVAAIDIETGLWEVTMNSQNPVSGQPIIETTRECIRDQGFDPATAMMEDNTCRITERKESGNTVTWKMECSGEGMPVFHGAGSFVSHGSTAEGKITMSMTMGAMTMEMENLWNGRKVASHCGER